MENKEMVSASKMSQHLMGNWCLWGLLYGYIYSFAFAVITRFMESIVLKAIIAVVAQGIIAIIVWKLSTSSSFKKRTISYNDVPEVMKKLIIFTIVICIITGISNISSVNSSIDEAVNSDFKLKYTESMMSYLYNDEQMAEYNKQKEKAIAEAKSKAYTYLVILEIGLTAVYLAVLPLEKKEILKYVS